MMRTTVKIRRRLPGGELVAAMVTHVDGRSHCFGDDVPDLHKAIEQAVADLESTYGAMPAPILDRAVWLAAVTHDSRTTAQAKRVAELIYQLRPDEWLGVHAIASELRMDFRNVPRSVGKLVRLGYLAKSRDGNRVLYGRTLP